ncbi:MAG: ABC transporter ATP-binding protein/permease [Firmicutes bacterium]|nr:ABC transporter ATP-binding protein/permease [Candidatus Fiminaster equi]
MLELKNIVKDYVSDNNVTHALKGISVNFRKNEFVSILGASGCGKTTTLNIIGGLDRYTSGDLIINGISTKNYTDRDWDTYRNHSIGFIFQTYNLIGHQNILKNVELALTISGVGKAERKARAMEALKKVGLEGMERKKPNQLSGGQCQRVAIARALINNPEILLADEPTGALDSETSVQIMDLLKEVASDRLVIMVTHNPELAEKYSTRIIRMSDGLLIDDSMPFDGVEPASEPVEEVNKGKKKQSSMSLATSTGLSLSNLRSKLKRTILVTIAGSIGIIGVSAVLAVSRGVKDFIGEMQNDMLSAYPVQIAEQSVDMTSLMNGLNAQDAKEHFVYDPEDPKVGVDSMINYLMTAYSDITKVKTNTIDKKLLAYIDAIPQESVAVTTKNYAIDPTNNIFGAWVDDSMQTKEEKEAGNTDHVYTRNMSFNGLTQRYIAELKTVEDFAAYASYVDLFTNFMKKIPDNKDYITSQYDVLAGDLTMNKDELVLVVDKNTTLTDLVLAQTGIFNHDEFLNIAHCAIDENEYKKKPEYNTDSPEVRKQKLDEIRAKYPYRKDFKYEDLLNRSFTYIPEDNIYDYDDEIATAEKTYSVAFAVTDGFGSITRFVYLTSQSLAGMNVLYGITMYKEADVWNSDQVAAISLDANPTIDSEACLYGTWYALNPSDLMTLAKLPQDEQMSYVMSHIKFSLLLAETGSKFGIGLVPTTAIDPDYSVHKTPIEGYAYDAEATQAKIDGGTKMKIGAILRLREDKRFGCLDRGLYYSNAFADQYMEDAKEAKVTSALKAQLFIPATRDVEFKAYVKFDYFSDKDKDMHHGYASSLNGDLSSSFSDLFSSITGVNHQETNALHLRSLSGLKTIIDKVDNVETVSFDKLPKKISIYPKSFEDKDVITKHLDKWNEDGQITVKVDGVDVVLEKNQREELSYTDTIQIIVKVITTLIDAITISLVVFTSLSLVVSCFMIAVITYISVVERIKEIGVIRSLGGRKRDVASLFTMENLLTGLFSGVFGIAITYLIQLILNIVLKSMFQITIANLTIPTALIMIVISVLLSVVSGFIPSQSAAHKDPVIALRSAE